MPVRYSLGTWPANAGVDGNSVLSQQEGEDVGEVDV